MMLSEKFKPIKGYFDDENRIEQWPSKFKKKLLVLEYLSLQFEPGKKYNEKEVNELLNEHHSFQDPALLRRGLFDCKFLQRTKDGRQYWLV